MSIVSSAVITAYTAASSYDASLQAIHEGIEAYLKKATGQPWESTTYTNKKYSGSGSYKLLLDETPIISVKYIIIEPFDAVKVKNTLTDTSLASVVVDATNITLTVEGGTGAGSDTLSKATNTTMALLVAAINAQSANGWSAEIIDTDYNALLTSQLFAQQLECVQENGVAQDWQYLQLGELAKGIKFDSSYVYCDSGFPYGFQNIFITYTAGYATIPADVTLYVLNAVKAMYTSFGQDTEGLKRWRVGDVEYEYELAKAGISIPDAILYGNVNVRI
jgi:hypothetical protein